MRKKIQHVERARVKRVALELVGALVGRKTQQGEYSSHWSLREKNIGRVLKPSPVLEKIIGQVLKSLLVLENIEGEHYSHYSFWKKIIGRTLESLLVLEIPVGRVLKSLLVLEKNSTASTRVIARSGINNRPSTQVNSCFGKE